MKLPVRLVRRRSLWVPTLWGSLLLLVVAAGALVLAARGLYPFLAINDPVRARILVIEGWMSQEGLDQALVAFRSGAYEQAVTTGAPFDKWPRSDPYRSVAERAADYLVAKGLPASAVRAVPGEVSVHDRTFWSAMAVREWARDSGTRVIAIDVFSEGAHARRSRLLYQKAFGPDVKVGVLAARSTAAGEEWWRTARGTREVLDQAIAFFWTKLFFRTPSSEKGSANRGTPRTPS